MFSHSILWLRVQLLLWAIAGLGGSFLLSPVAGADSSSPVGDPSPAPLCPAGVLSRLQTHRLAAGETLASVAAQYDLRPETLLGFNPQFREGQAIVGSEIVIPPLDGIRLEVPPGQTWRDLAKRFQVRADALFELNGCVNTPTVVFIPGVTWSPNVVGETRSIPEVKLLNQLSRSPLASLPTVLIPFGWQVDPATTTMMFRSGVGLQASPGTTVRAAGAGTVAFVGDRPGYGSLVVINHPLGLQTRYANLGTVQVRQGQAVEAGTVIATVGQPQGTNPSYLFFEVRRNLTAGWVAQDPAPYLQRMRTQ